MITATKKSPKGLLCLKKDSNIAYSVGSDNLLGMREGSMMQIDNQSSFVNVSDVQLKNFKFNFEKTEDKKLLIKQDIQNKLSIGDFITINLIKYEALGLSSIEQKGSDYLVGDIVQISDGEPTIDTVTNLANCASFEVTATNEVGGIKKLKLKSKGEYSQVPKQELLQLQGGSGENAVITLDFEECSEKKQEERQVVDIQRTPSFTFFVLDQSISRFLNKSSFEFKKWQVTLAANFTKEDGAYSYSLINKFSPNLKLPLMNENIQNPTAVYNSIILQLDSQIKDMKEQIDWIKSKLV